MKLNCFDVHFVICCCKEWRFHAYDDHRDPTNDDSLLMIFVYNPLGLEDLSRILNLTNVKFKIRGGLLRILDLENSAEESADGFC